VREDAVSVRRWWWRLLAPLAAAVVMGLAVHALGIAGYRVGWLWAGLLVAALPCVLVWRGVGETLGPRGIWVVAFAVGGLTATGWLVDHAPLSAGQLHDRMHDISPPFTNVLSEHRSGHSWCRPRCPRVTRVLRAPDTAPFAALLNTAAEMRVEGLMSSLEVVGRRHPVRYVIVPTARYVARVDVARRRGYLRLTITLTATRGRVHHPGPVQSDTTVKAPT
jgi:hypothetical protein